MLQDGYEVLPAPDGAVHRVRLDWRLSGDAEAPVLQDGLLYLHFYRLVFALAADEGPFVVIPGGAVPDLGV
jgi:hypothetical protein